MKLGDKVTWTSQAQGYTRTKVGVIVQVVPARSYPDREAFPSLYKNAGVGLYRDHESYVVKCAAKENNGKSGVYWPRANKLQPHQ